MGIILNSYSPFQEEDTLLNADDFQDGDILTVETIVNDQKTFVGKQPVEKMFFAQINQTGTNAPVVQVIRNDLGLTYTGASYQGVGNYYLTFSNVVVDATFIQTIYSPSMPIFDYSNVFKGYFYVNLDESAFSFGSISLRTSNTAGVAANSIISDPITFKFSYIAE